MNCACVTCECTVNPSEGLERNGQTYCSEACASGHTTQKGCGHAGCAC